MHALLNHLQQQKHQKREPEEKLGDICFTGLCHNSVMVRIQPLSVTPQGEMHCAFEVC